MSSPRLRLHLFYTLRISSRKKSRQSPKRVLSPQYDTVNHKRIYKLLFGVQPPTSWDPQEKGWRTSCNHQSLKSKIGSFPKLICSRSREWWMTFRIPNERYIPNLTTQKNHSTIWQITKGSISCLWWPTKIRLRDPQKSVANLQVAVNHSLTPKSAAFQN